MIKVLAIDDEPLALKQLASYIQKIPFFELSGECSNALQAKDIMNNEAIDAIFCDINMPDLNGMDFVKSLAAPPFIIFTTAYSQYAIEGYKVDAVDYLLKPFGFDEFRRAANKLKEIYDLKQSSITLHHSSAINEQPDTLFVKSAGRILNILISDIWYIEGMSEYVKIYLDSDPKPIITLYGMKKLEEFLPNYFMRIHRSYIINLKKIVEVNKNRVIMGPQIYLPIGEVYKEEFNQYLEQRILGK